MLVIERLNSYYQNIQVLRDLNLELSKGEVLCLLGRNGAGKTTLLKSIMGLVRSEGKIVLNNQNITDLPAYLIPKKGIGFVPQGRRLFSELSVAQNLEIGLMTRNTPVSKLDQIYDMFPVLKDRLQQESGTLSGGEQQMLAMARALCIEPDVLLLDEPTEGLMPSMIETIRAAVRTLRQAGVGVLLVEQRVDAVLPVADRVAFMENGMIQDTLTIDELNQKPELLKHYIGI